MEGLFVHVFNRSTVGSTDRGTTVYTQNNLTSRGYETLIGLELSDGNSGHSG